MIFDTFEKKKIFLIFMVKFHWEPCWKWERGEWREGMQITCDYKAAGASLNGYGVEKRMKKGMKYKKRDISTTSANTGS